ncbi:MAG TPA: amidohydrolase family protein [Polyangiales bacterium]|nr:amidohydrolase family protein [Polyangiales bacterium]
MTERKLLQGGTVLGLGRADILIEDGKITAISTDLAHADAEHIDVSGKLLMPGLIDTHRHTWQTLLRGLGCDWTVLDYLAAVRVKLAPAFSAEDVYLSNYAGALEALDCGVTTLVDHAHIINSPEHADAAWSGLQQAGVRALFAYGFASNDLPDAGHFTTHAARIEHARKWCTTHDSELVRAGVALSEMQIPWQDTCAELRCARELGLPITFHCASWPVPGMSQVERLSVDGRLGPDMLLVHCTHCSDDDLRRIADSGASISATPETELQMGMGFPIVGHALRHGIRTTLGADVVCSNNGDPFAMMRLALQAERGAANARAGLPMRLELPAARMLPMVTSDAAAAMGLGSTVGTLREGMQADIVLLSMHALNLSPAPLQAAAVVTQAHAGNVEDVLVRGRFVKRHGKLLGVDLPALQHKLSTHREALLDRVGGPDHLLSELPMLLQHWNIGQAEVAAGTQSA